MANVLSRIVTVIKARLVGAKTNTMPAAAQHPAAETQASAPTALDEHPVPSEETHGGQSRSTDESKAVLRRLIEEGWNKRNLVVFDECIAPDRVWHDPTGPDNGSLERHKAFAAALIAAFPDVQFTIDDQVAEGDKVASRMTMRGTQRGDSQGIPPTGKQVTVVAMAIDRIANGKIVETWPLTDSPGMLEQLGAILSPGHAGG